LNKAFTSSREFNDLEGSDLELNVGEVAFLFVFQLFLDSSTMTRFPMFPSLYPMLADSDLVDDAQKEVENSPDNLVKTGALK
jgi:hypothetical protein